MPKPPLRTSLLAALALTSVLGCASTGSYSPAGSPPAPAFGGVYVEEGAFGYASAGWIAYADFFGEVDGLDPGAGFSITLPIPPWLFVFAALVIVSEGDIDLDLQVEGDSADVWSSGYAARERGVISEFSMNVTFSSTRHRDELGGYLDYDAVLLGARLAGPRWRPVRPYFDAGYGWYFLQYDAPTRAEANIGGPYIGGGVELFAREKLSVSIDARAHLYLGENVTGELVEGGARQVGVVFTGYW